MSKPDQSNILSTILGFLILGLLAMGAWWLLSFIGGFLFRNSGDRPPEPEKTYAVKPNFPASYTESDLQDAIQASNRNDTAAFQQLLLSGKVILLKPDSRVYLQKCLGLACSIVKIRPQGTNQDLYTLNEALQKD